MSSEEQPILIKPDEVGSGKTRAVGSGKPRPVEQRSWFWTLVFVLVVAAGANVYGWTRPVEEGVIPEVIIGTWATTSPQYADRAFEVRSDSLIFHIGGNDSTVHAIERVEVEDLGGPMLLTVHYKEGSGVNQFSFYYDPARGGVIRFRNQRSMAWRKT